MNARDPEQRALAFLAAEYERDGRPSDADFTRGGLPVCDADIRALRAIVAALRQQPAPVDLEQFREAVNAYGRHEVHDAAAAAYHYRLLSSMRNAGKVASAEPVAWQRRYAHQLPAGGMCRWHEITRDEYEAAVSAEHPDRTYEYRALYAAPHQPAPVAPAARPMETAPRDGRMLRLLVDFDEHATEDAPGPAWTIGANTADGDGEDHWKFAGWCWTHDHFTEGKGTPVGWLPMHTEQPTPVVDDARMARALEWVRALTKPCSAEEREMLNSIEEAIAAYNPSFGARTVRGVDDEMRELIEAAKRVCAAWNSGNPPELKRIGEREYHSPAGSMLDATEIAPLYAALARAKEPRS